MNRIDQAFQQAKKKGKPLFIAYIMAGDPSLKETEKLVPALEKAGVGIIELGIPFSDPIADGAVNQEAGMRALNAGATLHKVLDSVKTIREKTEIPIVLFSYLNPILQYGTKEFSQDAVKAGVDGTLALDLPPEESSLVTSDFKEAGLKTIFLITPTTPKERIKKISSLASGFIYYVSRLGVTGVQHNLAEGLQSRLDEIRTEVKVPIAVGFGISEPQHIQQLKDHCEAIVVGSAIVKRIAEKGDDPSMIPSVTEFVQTLTREL